ncbi:MAG: PAS domain S-box protein [Rhodospirillales bacterium]|nr:PAS domain S-box protein [Rhodospirillales bacterium]MCB9965741.1 PAS domain S-box protein [Rhodospirillales bacterium]MCB9979669.1 PAS domain S-box protein [Rhodospirillales bacterium]
MTQSSVPLNVLLIEDNHTDYLLTSRVFSALSKDRQTHIDWCQTYEDGFRALERKEHDICLVDYILGNKTGLDLVEECQQKKISGGPFILLTDYQSPEIYTRSVNLGIYDHLLKRELTPSLLERTLSYAMLRFKIEADLKSEKEFTSFILAEIPYMVISVDQDSTISMINPATLQLLGKSKAEMIDRPWKQLLYVDDRENIQYEINKDGDVFFEARVLAKGGQERNVRWNVLNREVVAHHKSDSAAFILFGQDITDQIRLEENELRRQKMEALGQLAGGVAHEINNLLQPILMSTQLVKGRIESDSDKIDPDYLIKNMSRIERNAQSAAKIVDDILLFSRGDQKQTECLNIFEVLKEAVGFVKEMLPPTIQVMCDKAPEGEKFEADINRNEMTQIVTNLMINAAHAMEQHGTISLHADQDYVSMEESGRMNLSPGRYVRIGITDTGCGIPPENIDRIFNPFFTTKEVGEGTGLGLAIVYKIIEKWGGTIKVKSKVGTGTTFSIYIPVH